VTPLQMCAMYATIANDGYYVSPRIIKEVYKDGKPVYFGAHAERRAVISKDTADLMCDFMADVVTHGTGVNAHVDSLDICGKTGTAHVVKANGGGYAAHRYISSFGGFFPKDDPQIVIYIMIKEPRGAYYGGSVAAPCFKRIAERLVHIEGLNYFKKENPENLLVDNHAFAMPNLVGLEKDDAIKMMRTRSLDFRVYGDGSLIVAQEPAPGDSIPDHDFIYLTTDMNMALRDSVVAVPSVIDLPVRNAVNLLTKRQFKVEIQGSGAVARQEPSAGEMVAVGRKIRLVCKSVI
jgi:membrane peptidoglycan carboxypeptidase